MYVYYRYCLYINCIYTGQTISDHLIKLYKASILTTNNHRYLDLLYCTLLNGFTAFSLPGQFVLLTGSKVSNRGLLA